MRANIQVALLQHSRAWSAPAPQWSLSRLSSSPGDCMQPSSAAAQIDQASTDARWAQWANLKPKLWASPIFGHGRGMSGDTISYYYPGALSPTVDSYTLTLLADVGFPGTFFFYGIIVFSVLAGARQYIFGRSQSGALAGALSLLSDRVRRLSNRPVGAGEFLPLIHVCCSDHRDKRRKPGRISSSRFVKAQSSSAWSGALNVAHNRRVTAHWS